ncbi:polyprenol monophosphomannose synthase [Chlorobium sp. N1]|uniref:polyprenol monophosphomannose synthase n=1 Tax=Chlorobium sp. N1 TaxID=2491138 RepID=UPI00103D5FB2|nr:polyprenol monophosphomannose synthase [Chlorobium sp. N1]TCD48042.1 polyprenol monophosphomannose synthase [Chlorobium sp. N1]
MNEELRGDAGAAPSLVIIPTYNESENVGRLLETLMASYGRSLDILVIDDCSPDGTAEIVRRLQERFTGLHLIERAGKLGLGTAYITGFRWALRRRYRFILEMDADFSHDPASVGALIAAAEGADLVIGSRYVGNRVNVVNWPLGRLILSKGASIYTRLVTGMPVADPTGGFKCFRREVLEQIELDRVASQGYSFQIEVNFRVWKKGLRIVEVPIVFTDRTVGLSKMTKENIREAVWMVWMLKLKSLFGRL